jgi:hypothetical protein
MKFRHALVATRATLAVGVSRASAQAEPAALEAPAARVTA